jgi:Domain of unknown function (DUF1996)
VSTRHSAHVRYQAPSCWDGKHLESPHHKSHMAYPKDGRCPSSHPVAVPMVEFKMALPAAGDMSQVHLSSGRGYSFHYDFYNAWDPASAASPGRCLILGSTKVLAGQFCDSFVGPSRSYVWSFVDSAGVCPRRGLLHRRRSAVRRAGARRGVSSHPSSTRAAKTWQPARNASFGTTRSRFVGGRNPPRCGDARHVSHAVAVMDTT